MAFNADTLFEKTIGTVGGNYSVTSVTETTKPTKERRGFHEVEKVDLIEGWRQIIAGQWRGIGLLDVLEPLRHTWGSQILIAEPGRDRGKLQTHYPGLMIFTPKEFQDAVKHWPDNSGVILAERIFDVEILEGKE